MRFLPLVFSTLFALQVTGQGIDSVNIPQRVVYKYCDPNVIEKAKKLLSRELSESVSYDLDNGIVFVGPTLWSRYKKVPRLEAIPGGNMTILYNKEKLAAKATQNKDGFMKIWDQVISETKASSFILRKATYNELDYYWSVISFDIQEPLLIAETNDHRFIMNLAPESFKLVWVDEVPTNITK